MTYIAHHYSLYKFTPPLILGLKKILGLSVGEISYSHLNAGEALSEQKNTRSLRFNNSMYQSIITTRSFHRTGNELLSAARKI